MLSGPPRNISRTRAFRDFVGGASRTSNRRLERFRRNANPLSTYYSQLPRGSLSRKAEVALASFQEDNRVVKGLIDRLGNYERRVIVNTVGKLAKAKRGTVSGVTSLVRRTRKSPDEVFLRIIDMFCAQAKTAIAELSGSDPAQLVDIGARLRESERMRRPRSAPTGKTQPEHLMRYKESTEVAALYMKGLMHAAKSNLNLRNGLAAMVSVFQIITGKLRQGPITSGKNAVWILQAIGTGRSTSGGVIQVLEDAATKCQTRGDEFMRQSKELFMKAAAARRNALRNARQRGSTRRAARSSAISRSSIPSLDPGSLRFRMRDSSRTRRAEVKDDGMFDIAENIPVDELTTDQMDAIRSRTGPGLSSGTGLSGGTRFSRVSDIHPLLGTRPRSLIPRTRPLIGLARPPRGSGFGFEAGLQL